MNPKVKEINIEVPGQKCQFCHKSNVNTVEWGQMYQLSGITAHYFCILFSAHQLQNGRDNEGILGFLPADIRKELRRGQRLKCMYCGMTGATIKCCKEGCKSSYHYPCAFARNCYFLFDGTFTSFCEIHATKPEIPLSRSQWTCPICFIEILDGGNPICPPCCSNYVVHKSCLMEMAVNHGSHHFRCLSCDDKAVFTVAMQRSGVFVPIRDATWEMVPNAFADQGFRYSRCDAVICKCPNGREFDSKVQRNQWVIVRCGACSASGVHKCCGDLKTLTWRCPTCTDVLTGIQTGQRVQSSDESGQLTIDVHNGKRATDLPEIAANSPSSSAYPTSGRILYQLETYDGREKKGFVVGHSQQVGSTWLAAVTSGCETRRIETFDGCCERTSK